MKMIKIREEPWWSALAAQRGAFPRLRGVIVAVACVAVISIPTLLLTSLLPIGLLFPLFFIAVLISTWQGGAASGLLASFLALLVVDFLLMPPMWGLSISQSDLERLGVFIFVSLLITALGSARNRSERRIREAERKYRDIFASAGEGIFQTTPDGKHLTANPALARMLGFDSPADLVRERTDIAAQQYVDPRRREEFKRLLEENDFVRGFEYESYREDGRKIWLSDSVRAVRDERGKLLYYEGIAEDITERKRAETRSAAFAALAHKLSDARVPRDAAQIIADTADELFGWDSCRLAHYCSKWDLVHSILNIDTIDGQRVSVTPELAPYEPTVLSRQVISEGGQLLLREEPYEFDEDSIPFGDHARPSASMMTVPIRHGSEVIGLLSIQSYVPKAYDRDGLNSLQALADHCGGVMNRLRGERALRESEGRKRAILEAALDCIVTMNHQGVIVDWNPAAERTFGYPEAKAVGAEMAELIIPERLREQHRRGLAHFLVTGKGPALGRRLELTALRADGSEFPVELAISVIRSEGTPMFTAYLRDITDRKRDEEALRVSEDLLRGAFDNAPIGMVVNAPDGRRLKVNRAFCEMLGYSEKELLQTNWWSVLHPDRQEPAAETSRQFITGLTGIKRVETHYVHQAGHVVWANISATIVRDADGQPLYAVAQVEDITERKRAEQSLKLFRSLIDQTGDAIEVLDPVTLRFLDCNESACRSLGYSHEELLSLNVFDIDPNINEANLAGIEAELANHGFAVFESVHRRKSGSTFPVEVNVQRVQLEREYRVAVARDITERKLADEALRESEARYRDLVENSREFICTHDLNGLILSANRAATEALGYDLNEWCGKKNYRELLAPEVRDQFDDYLARIRRDGFAGGLTLVQTKAGERRVLEYHNTLRTEGVTTPIVRGMARDITERREGEKALRVSEQKYRDIFSLAPVGICQSLPDGTLITANQALATMLGYDSIEELLQVKLDSDVYFVTEERQALIATYEPRGYAGDLEVQLKRKDGSPFWVQLNAHAVKGPGDATEYFESFVRDITERKQSEELLRQSASQLAEAQHVAHVGSWNWNIPSNTLTWSDELYRIYGVEPQEFPLTFEDFLVRLHPDDREYVARSVAECLASHEPFGFQERIIRPDGEMRVLQSFGNVVCDDDGNPIRMFGACQDISERKRTEAALRESEERYRELFENARDAIYVHDLKGRYTSVNRAAEKLIGYTRDDILGKSFADMISPKYFRQVRKNLRRKLVEDRETSYEVEVIGKDGRSIPVEVSSRLIYENDVVVGVQGTARDITERRRAQDKLRTYSSRLIHAQEEERQRIARELHDQIGQVLTAAQINLHTVMSVCNTPEASARVKESIRVLDEALVQVRDLSLDLRPSLLDDLGLVSALRWYVDRQAQRTGVRAEVITELPDHVRFSRDLETACFRIAQEALTNVARHAQAQRVWVRLQKDRTDLLLTIKDDGVGFDVNALRQRAPSAATLGLQGMEERAYAVGVKIEIESAPSRGTQIRCRCPIDVRTELTKRDRMRAGNE